MKLRERSAARLSPRWEDARTVAGFVSSPPNDVLLEFAQERLPPSGASCLDLGCGAGRNAVPLAQLGYQVTGTDLAAPMLTAAAARLAREGVNISLVLAPMAPLPFHDATFDLIVAHGIWNLATSGRMFRMAIAEAARVAKHGAGLFLFTFSRHSLPEDAGPDPGESFVFSSWNGEAQCFLSEREIIDELGAVGFRRTSSRPLTEYNRRSPATIPTAGPPVIYEGTFNRVRG